MRYYRPRRYRKYIFVIICFIMVAVTLFLLLDARLRPIVRNTAVVQAQNYAATVAGSAVPDVLRSSGADYSSLVEIVRDKNGNIVSVQTDAMRINQIKSGINTAVASHLSNLDGKQLGVPIGSLTGLALLNGRGPRLNVIISLTGSAQTHFVNEFSSAGVNQTRHQIFLKTTVTLLIVFPTTTVTTAYTMNMLAAETIIVGKVPLAYGEITQK
ncbi:MAG: sporulation protein YunB [Clostridia bacterium]|nr:sporulation protein YunB [Clostridia bacterium]